MGVVPQRKERREQDKEKGKKEKEERGGGKSKARIGEIEDQKTGKKSTCRRMRKDKCRKSKVEIASIYFDPRF